MHENITHTNITVIYDHRYPLQAASPPLPGLPEKAAPAGATEGGKKVRVSILRRRKNSVLLL